LSDEVFRETGSDEPQGGELHEELWNEAMAQAEGDEAAARILYVQLRGSQTETGDGALRRLVRVMDAREELDSAAPSVLLWALVSSMMTIAFAVVGFVRRDFLLAAIAAGVAAVLWWKYLHSAHRTTEPPRQEAKR